MIARRHARRALRSSGWRWAVCLIALLSLRQSAAAHGLLPMVLQLVEVRPDRFLLSLRSPLASDDQDGIFDRDLPLRPRFPAHCRVLATQLDCLPSTEGAPHGLAGHAISVERNPDSQAPTSAQAELIVVITWRDGRQTSDLLRAAAGHDRLDLPTLSAESPLPRSAVLFRYVRLGLHHILSLPQGADHLLFILSLMLLVPSLTALLGCITAFTLGHSVTLVAAALDLLRVPQAPIEILIALSIVFVARSLVWVARSWDAHGLPGTRRGALLDPSPGGLRSSAGMAAAFGLLHGLGFASALTEAGLPTGQRLLALLSFNLGVEVGQLVWVGLWLLPWVLYRRHAAAGTRLWLRLGPAYAVGCFAAALTLSRLWDVFFASS